MSIIEFYNAFYSKAEKSKAHGIFCEKVYGINLCQHGMADAAQINALMEETGIDESSTVLDVGCGTGSITNHIQEKTNCRITGLDVSPAAIESAVNTYSGKSERIDFVVGDIESHALEANAYDAILLIDTHYFIDDFPALITRLLCALKDNGNLAIFSDEGRGIDGADDSKVQADETLIGQYLDQNKIPYRAINLSKENAEHWKKKQEVLIEMKEMFLQENNQFIYENRLGECEDHDRSWDCRFLFIVQKAVT